MVDVCGSTRVDAAGRRSSAKRGRFPVGTPRRPVNGRVHSSDATAIARAIPGLDVAAYSRPADGSGSATGDFVELVPTGPQRWFAVVGDVCGRGPAAAQIADYARRVIRTAAADSAGPKQLLSTLNQAMAPVWQRRSRFLSAVCLMLTPADEATEVVVSAGGHPPVLVRRGDGRVEHLHTPGAVLGTFDDPGLTESRLRLRPAEVLLAYTDGVIEARNGREQYGHRLPGLFARTSQRGSGAIIADIVDDVLAYAGGTNRDDLALLTVRGLPPFQPPGGLAAA